LTNDLDINTLCPLASA